jgi:hypothetical protein
MLLIWSDFVSLLNCQSQWPEVMCIFAEPEPHILWKLAGNITADSENDV